MLEYYRKMEIDDLEGWSREELRYLETHAVVKTDPAKLRQRRKYLKEFIKQMKRKDVNLYQKVFPQQIEMEEAVEELSHWMSVAKTRCHVI